MEITVITPYDSSNYGAYLQAYCLKNELEAQGHKVYHTPTRSAEFVKAIYYKDKPIRKKEKLFPLTFKKNQKFGQRKYEMFKKDIEVFNIREMSDCKSDLYVLGSDEIWNINQQSFRNPIFWGIGMEPVISYAASIGSADKEMLKKYPEQINAVRKLSSALVRDIKTKEFLKEVCGVESQIVCDPTMLVPVESYGREFKDEYLEKNDCILVYAYNTLNKDCIDAIRSYAKKNRLKVVGCCFNHSWCDHICECSPLEFSSLIRQCKAVITATFHGSIFSILNHANFISVPYSPKTSQLLTQFGIENRLLGTKDFSVERISSILDGEMPDYKDIEEKISDIREKSKGILKSAIEFAVNDKKFDYQICPSDSCSACFACMNKCPKNAIECTVDIYGRTMPMINPELCVQCGMCKKVCPANNPVDLNEPIKCYASIRKDEEEHKKSASGGIGAVLSERIISQGGVVYGAAFERENDKLILKHSKAETLEQAEKFRGSKYVQSFIGGDIYRDVLKELKTGRNVLFTGTPCHIGALQNFLGKDYDNLYTVDLICHGVPPMQYLTEHLEKVAGDKKVTDVTFRIGPRDFVLYVKSGDETVFKIFRDSDTYYKSFIRGQDFRENCYSCRYSAPERCSDISIGDYWLDKTTLEHPMDGKITVVVVNTDKGEDIIQQIRDDIILEERDYEEAKSLNDQLNKPSIKYKDRDLLLETYRKTQKIEEAINSTVIKKEIETYNFLNTTLPGRVIRKIIYIKENGKWK